MTKKEFLVFCDDVFKKYGYQKKKGIYFLHSNKHNLISYIKLQKSNYGEAYYVNFYFFLAPTDISFSNTDFPSINECNMSGRITVMSKKETINGLSFETALIEYTEYSNETLSPYFDNAFKNYIIPPVIYGKEYVLNHMEKFEDLFDT